MKKLAILFLTTSLLLACTSPTKKTMTDENQIEKNSTETALKKAEEIQKFRDIGFKYASTTKQTLGKNLSEAIQTGGTENALSFCNIQAMPLTDSMSSVYNAKIMRVSDKPRNPSNKANTKELEQINYYKTRVAEGKTGKEIQPNVEIVGNQVHFYYPIITNAMCLQCHGTKNDEVKPETLAQLSKLYPDDMATGYKDNEVRGIWSIIFEK